MKSDKRGKPCNFTKKTILKSVKDNFEYQVEGKRTSKKQMQSHRSDLKNVNLFVCDESNQQSIVIEVKLLSCQPPLVLWQPRKR